MQLKKSNSFREKDNKNDTGIEEDGYENDKNVDEEIKTPIG